MAKTMTQKAAPGLGLDADLARKGRPGRPTVGTRAMTNAERTRLWRLRHQQ